jgi:hypothetical protein
MRLPWRKSSSNSEIHQRTLQQQQEWDDHIIRARQQRDMRTLRRQPKQPMRTMTDEDLFRMMKGADFGPGAQITLPSGKTISGDEMQAWVSLNTDD